MVIFLKSHPYLVTLTVLLCIGVATFLTISSTTRDDTRILTTVDEGPVRNIVSVSGTLRAEKTAELGFASGGTVETIHVRKGDTVAEGSLLISIDAASLAAELSDAAASLAAAKADYATLLAGASTEAREVSDATVTLRSDALARIKNDEALKVNNALRTLRSSNLAAYTNESSEAAPAPTILGTYLCESEGTYTLDVYSSNADSGYSVVLSGIETGTFAASTEQPAALGTCGLKAQFTSGVDYHRSQWHIDIPNSKSATYITNTNAYELAVANQKSAVSQAERELQVARAEATSVSAPARSEAITRSEALIAQAEARVAKARIATKDTALRAPFAGTVVALDTVVGETITNSPLITLVAPDNFELTARLAEIDVGKVAVGQTAEVVFDTAAETPLKATVDFISPTATLIDGVAYFEARLALQDMPTWLRGGLNADVQIIIEEKNGPRLPKRFITTINGVSTVLKAISNTDFATTSVEVSLFGNDGYAYITGVAVGDTVIAP